MADKPLLLTPTWTQIALGMASDAATPAGTVATNELMRPVVPANSLLGLPSAWRAAGRDETTGIADRVLSRPALR